MPQSTEMTRWTPSACEPIERRRLQAVPVAQALRDEVDDVGAEQLERAAQNDRRRDAVDVVVAVNRDALLAGRSRARMRSTADGMSVSANGSSRSSSDGDRKRRAWSRSEMPRMHSSRAVTGERSQLMRQARSASRRRTGRGCQRR